MVRSLSRDQPFVNGYGGALCARWTRMPKGIRTIVETDRKCNCPDFLSMEPFVQIRAESPMGRGLKVASLSASRMPGALLVGRDGGFLWWVGMVGHRGLIGGRKQRSEASIDGCSRAEVRAHPTVDVLGDGHRRAG